MLLTIRENDELMKDLWGLGTWFEVQTSTAVKFILLSEDSHEAEDVHTCKGQGNTSQLFERFRNLAFTVMASR